MRRCGSGAFNVPISGINYDTEKSARAVSGHSGNPGLAMLHRHGSTALLIVAIAG
jgi:hypothetical protein